MFVVLADVWCVWLYVYLCTHHRPPSCNKGVLSVLNFLPTCVVAHTASFNSHSLTHPSHHQAEATRLLDTQLSKSAEAVRKEQVAGEEGHKQGGVENTVCFVLTPGW